MRHDVRFKEVGSNKKSWTHTFNQLPTEPMLERIVRRQNVLASREVACVFEEATHGLVFSGIRVVGSFDVCAIDPTTAGKEP